LRFKLDENMPADLASRLRIDGHDVRNVVEEGLAGKRDPLVFLAAVGESRILATFDLDFADIRLYPLGTHSGILVFRLRDQRWKTMEGPVDRILASGILETLGGGLAIVDETRVRRKLPKPNNP
jgi:predicted nuclease of predicted toxin-antitoxin system